MTRSVNGQIRNKVAYSTGTQALVGMALLLNLGIFWPTLASFPGTWGRYGMAHGWLVAGLVLWMVWRDRRHLINGTAGIPLAVPSLAAMSLVWFASTVAHVQLFHQLAFLLLVLLWGLVVFSRKAVPTLIGGAVTFLLALPLWDVLVPLLRPVTTLTSGGMVRLFGIPAVIEGDIISIETGSFVIADGCAGLNYLLAGLVVGALYAQILLKRWRSQLAVVGLAAAISVVGNWVRVASVIVIGHVTEMQAGIINNHGSLGWAIFSLSLVPFFLLANRVGKGGWKEPGYGDGGSEPGRGDREVGREKEKEQARFLKRRVFVATSASVIGPALYFIIGALPTEAGSGLTPTDLEPSAQWRLEASASERPFDWRPAYQGAEEEKSWAFTDGTAYVYLDHFVYRRQAQGAKLIGYPNSIGLSSNVLDHRLVGPVGREGNRWIRQAVIRTEDGPVLTWYWYRVGGVATSSPVYAKLLEVPAFLARRRVSELIALSAPCELDSCEEAFRALAEFMGAEKLVAS